MRSLQLRSMFLDTTLFIYYIVALQLRTMFLDTTLFIYLLYRSSLAT